MEAIINLLTDPKLLSILSLPMVCIGVEAYAIWKLFKLYNDLQESRLGEAKKMNEEYAQLCKDVNKTLDTLLQVIGRNNNGNGK